MFSAGQSSKLRITDRAIQCKTYRSIVGMLKMKWKRETFSITLEHNHTRKKWKCDSQQSGRALTLIMMDMLLQISETMLFLMVRVDAEWVNTP